MSNTKLKNAPLKEVIFELHWSSAVDNSGIQIDLGFDLAQGKFSQSVKSEYPVHKKLIPDNIPIKIYGAPLHQYWKAESMWPVIQHGQGMLAVNDVELNYEWENSFKPNVLSAIEKLIASYEEVPTFNRVKLQYIDAWDVEDNDSRKFIAENLLTEIKFSYPEPGIAKNFNIFQSFQMDDSSEIQLVISNGINNINQKQSIVWTTTIEKISNFDSDEIENWLEKAHSELSKMFKNMLKPEFYADLN